MRQKLYLLPEWRGKGLGGKLFNYMLQFVKDAASGWPCRIQFHVNRYNTRAINMYRHYGMQVLQEADFPIGHGFYMNDYVMGKEL